MASKVVTDKTTKKSLGFGFVKFAREEDARAAIEAKNGYLMGHKKLKVSVARPPSEEIRNCKLYLTNLPREYTETNVIELFKEVRATSPVKTDALTTTLTPLSPPFPCSSSMATSSSAACCATATASAPRA